MTNNQQISHHMINIGLTIVPSGLLKLHEVRRDVKKSNSNAKTLLATYKIFSPYSIIKGVAREKLVEVFTAYVASLLKPSKAAESESCFVAGPSLDEMYCDAASYCNCLLSAGEVRLASKLTRSALLLGARPGAVEGVDSQAPIAVTITEIYKRDGQGFSTSVISVDAD